MARTMDDTKPTPPTAAPSGEWRKREAGKLASGKYKSVPWAKEPWFVDLPEGDARRDHFAHISERDPWMLAYTPTPADGERARILPIKPGRYLQKFFGDVLTADHIRTYASQVRGSGLTIMYARDEAKIREVYQTSNVSACMSYGAGHYRAAHFNGGLHPTAAYAESDLSLAYALDPEKRIIARALVWQERKLYSRAYGDHEAMNKALQAEGYTYGLLDGAALRAIPLKEHPNYYTSPYIDHIKWARHTDGKLTLQVAATGATHSVQHGDGIAYPIASAPPRPAGVTGESIAAEHRRLCALEVGEPEPKVEAAPAVEAPPIEGLIPREVQRFLVRPWPYRALGVPEVGGRWEVLVDGAINAVMAPAVEGRE